LIKNNRGTKVLVPKHKRIYSPGSYFEFPPRRDRAGRKWERGALGKTESVKG
jgi:hypothetical protein